MTEGYSGTPLPKKLGIKEGSRLISIEGPDDLVALLDPMPSGVHWTQVSGAHQVDGERKEVDVVLLFCLDSEVFEAELDAAIELITWEGGLWVCWPKKASKLETDLSDSVVRERGLATGLVDNKVCAVDRDWSGLRFVHRRENRPPKGR